MHSFARQRLMGFPGALRDAGLDVDPSRAINFLAAITRLDLRGAENLRQAGRVTLTSQPADFSIFDAVFKSWFASEIAVTANATQDDDEVAQRPSSKPNPSNVAEFLPSDAAGQDASPDDLTAKKTFSRAALSDAAALLALKSLTFPRIETRRWRSSHHGQRIDLTATTAAARKTFGETLRLERLARPSQPRRILLLIDVSGSMKVHTEIYLRAAHALTHSGAKVETFCFSTQLTRATAPLHHAHADEALRRLACAVHGIDGGTRIGDSLASFLNVSRYAALVRGAITVILSDGLECGATGAISAAVVRLARLSHRLVWLTPLAHDPRYRPVTRAMSAILPHIDCLADASDLSSLLRAFSNLTGIEKGPRAQAARQWQISRRPT